MTQIWCEKKWKGRGKEKEKEKEKEKRESKQWSRWRGSNQGSLVSEDGARDLLDHLAMNVRLLLGELIIAMAIKKMPYCRAMWPHIALLLTNQIAI